MDCRSGCSCGDPKKVVPGESCCQFAAELKSWVLFCPCPPLSTSSPAHLSLCQSFASPCLACILSGTFQTAMLQKLVQSSLVKSSSNLCVIQWTTSPSAAHVSRIAMCQWDEWVGEWLTRWVPELVSCVLSAVSCECRRLSEAHQHKCDHIKVRKYLICHTHHNQ